MSLGPGAAQELATRVGAFVREGDVDRRRQGHLVVGELDKLRLYRPGAVVSADDVRALVPEAVPGTVWGLLDAVAARRVGPAAELAERLVEATPAPVLLAVLHRRIRELLIVADLVGRHAPPAEIMKTLKAKAYPTDKLIAQARAWSIDDLEAALSGLLELDIAIKGSDRQASPGQVRLAFAVWLAECVAPSAGVGRATTG
jgi:DNA polymerase III delta subunit